MILILIGLGGIAYAIVITYLDYKAVKGEEAAKEEAQAEAEDL